MEANERIRELHRPDWLPVFVGTIATFALMGVLSMVGIPAGLLDFKMTDSVMWIVSKLFVNIVCIVGALYIGGYVTGILMAHRNRTTAAMNGFLVWELTAIAFGVTGWFGYAPIPGVYFTHGDVTGAGPGILWMSLSFLLPMAIPSAYGACAGNDHVGGEELPEEAIVRDEFRNLQERRTRHAA